MEAEKTDAEKRPHQGEKRPPNDLPEAHDPTTQKIHDMANFHVSEAVGIPLLSKDVGTTKRESGAEAEGRLMGGRANATTRRGLFGSRDNFGTTGGGVFEVFGYHDRLAFVAVCAMVLLPLLFGAMRH